ncbi:UNVERIFIED_ORG: hypothetical protein BDU10_2562 [Burkholderia sp. CF145]
MFACMAGLERISADTPESVILSRALPPLRLDPYPEAGRVSQSPALPLPKRLNLFF